MFFIYLNEMLTWSADTLGTVVDIVCPQVAEVQPKFVLANRTFDESCISVQSA
ncbi:MAG: hypothetical protein RM368_09140 [Nostoc sp. DedSLP03]|nr:hypothetical protein [Nostoc sp. DedSLP03]